ncbi:photoreceptor cilium actin regulator [Myripristis murdjan]|uniref:photoreceptor cilium actin regulator n=1 Tax=Myripristis murdjan TaxID=586833 RepID=UPI0011764318|nr:photoreceptor cilium actin regulator [Myripristis murdjan]
MGCSPSKGNNFGTQGSFRRGRMLLPATQESHRESQSEDGESRDSTGTAHGDAREKTIAEQTHSLQKEAHSTPQKKRSVSELAPEAVSVDKLGNQGVDNNTVTQGKEKHVDKKDLTDKKPVRKPKKNNRGIKPVKKKEKEKKALPLEEKVDFPEPLVKAHQAAYAFLNPSINKYDILLGLLEQATQTQVSVQPMVAFMALRYEEIIRGLEDMADEGDKLLKENGEHLAWPSQMKNLSSSPPLKSGSANTEPPPDLLQQLLQYTTQRMRNVSQTVGGIGDSALEEAVDYFASVSELLDEKLKAKRAVETRLMQLLTRIETASLRKPGPEDSALFSEDSGIGAESESLAGSEKRHRRESCESTGTNRNTPSSPLACNSMKIRQVVSRRKLMSQISPSVSLTSIDSTCTIMAKEQKDSESLLGSVSLDDGEEDDDDDDEMDGGMENRQAGFRMRSNSSPVDSNHQPRRLPPKRIENPLNVEMTLKMKDAISGRIQFLPSPHPSAKTKIVDSPKTSRRQWAEDEEQSPKRPQTAAATRRALVKKTSVAKERRSRSAESLRSKAEDPTLLELERTQKDLNHRLERMNKSKVVGNTRGNPCKKGQGNSPAQSPALNRARPSLEKNNSQPIKDKTGLVRCNSREQEATSDTEDQKKRDKKISRGPMKATPPPSPPSSPRPSSSFHRGRNSVKKLIDTFSQGIEEQDDPRVLGPLKGVRKCGVPVLPGLGNVEAVLSAGITSYRPQSTSSVKTDDLDLDSLPPPPPEVLMDNSFESAQRLCGAADDRATKGGKGAKRAVVSQRLRASVQAVTVLPSKGSLPQGSKVISSVRGARDIFVQSNVSPPDDQPENNIGEEKADSLYKQARKIIHLQHPSDSNLEKSTACNMATKTSLSQAESAEEQDCSSFPVPGPNTSVSTVPHSSVVSSQPPATPPMSKTRMLPSTPSTPSSLHRRLPSPNTLRRQPTPPSSTSPPVNRKLPTPPALQRRLPSPPVGRQSILNSNSSPSYPFKAPSPPASPKVQRWSRENSSEESSISRLISNARSVFCPASPSLFEAQPCPAPRPPQAWTSSGVSILPRPWGNRGRLPVSVQGPRPFIRRTQSDRRPSQGLPPRAPCISVAHTCGSEPAISAQGLEDETTREDELWGSQSDLRATPRSASHPNLCVVGQALHRD